jgi:histidyl-tRNA synthetase
MNNMNNSPQTLKGFRDFLPEKKRKRDFVMGKIIQTFESFGFEPLETPTLEYASLLTGKYGAEADKLLYTFKDRGDREVGLRYDQTVPTARVLSQYQDKLPKYFRRYQVQNVFRADKPQKGRYREFTQCDIDIFGSSSPISDAEILTCTYQAFKNIGFSQVLIKINDRQTLLSNLEPFAKKDLDVFSIIQSIDKLSKIDQSEVIDELTNKGLAKLEAETIIKTITNPSKISSNLEAIIKQAKSLGISEDVIQPDPTLARGLDYYTGMIFEVFIPDYLVGSVGGGGRYDNLISELGGVDIPAVGMAFGFDRTVEAADQLDLIPSENLGVKVLVTIFDESLQEKSLKAAQELRGAGIKTSVFPAIEKLGKQFKYANQQNIPFVIVIGENEIKENQVTLKNMTTGDQQTLSIQEAIELLS